MRYSLANYICSIKPNDQQLVDWFGTINIGGEGSAIDSLSASRKNSLFDTADFATGGYVHNKNLSKVGTITISLNQLANNIDSLRRLANLYHTNEFSGLTITLTNSDGEEICTGIDCVPVQIPNQEFTASAGSQTWSFTCGEVNFK